MKKTLFMSFIALTFVSTGCSSEESVDAPKSASISFDNVFVGKSVRGTDLTADNIADFGVYGYMDNVTGAIFTNEKVSRSGSDWTYVNTQYWTAGHDYWFCAIAPFGAAGYVAPSTLPGTAGTEEFGTLTFDNSQQLDLCYAAQDKVAGMASGNAPVAFTFKHLLARTKFTFKNEATNQNVKFVISDIKITDAVQKGTITLGNDAVWTATADNVNGELVYTIAGTELEQNATLASSPAYLLPIAGTYTVTFRVKVLQGTVEVGEYDKTVTIPATVTLTRNFSYNFTCSLTYANVVTDAEPIVFTVEGVEDWADYTDNEITI